ncbi:MAG TPA: LPXTG cell wall anchor domain-containing protein [Pilimelia sp.]|nr:LPXTG cell wall anchor domain-containing protein [Pilimelia sp.]
MSTTRSRRLSVRLGLGAAVLMAAVVTPTVAFAGSAAAPAPETATLVAVAELNEATGSNKRYRVDPGQPVPALFGVANGGEAAVDGVVLHIRALGDLRLPRDFDNCRYYKEGTADGAFCQFDQDLTVGGTYAVADGLLATAPGARDDKVQVAVFRWWSRAWADSRGGLEGLVAQQVGAGAPSALGTGDTLALESRPLTLPALKRPINFVYVDVNVPPTPTPTPTAAPTTPPGGQPTPTATPTATATATAPRGGTAGGLPVTGTNTGAILGFGGALLLLGGAGFLLARRRSTRFVA